MRTLQYALLGLTLLAVGCRANNSTVMLERDLRLQEDKIYQLQSMLEDSCGAREATIRENQALKKELAGGDAGAGSDRDRGSSSLKSPSVEIPGLPSGDPPSRGRSAPPKLEAPVIELPESSDSPGVEVNPSDSSAVAEGQPTQLVINKRLTGGLDRDGHDGDEGILVVVEPRDAAGHLVRSKGTVSVVVMDPALEGPAARVARWDFAAHELASHFQNTVFGRGLQFELPWPAEPPRNRRLQLFVRFTTEDGKKLTTETSIDVHPSADMPNLDRQTQSGAPNSNASRTSRTHTPASRLKTRSSQADPSQKRVRSNPTDSAAAAPEEDTRETDAPAAELAREPAAPEAADSAPNDSPPAVKEPVRQASKPGRPTWKPFR